MKTMRILALSFLIGVISLYLLACETEKPAPIPPAKPPLTMTVATFTKAIAHAPLYVALHHGWFQEDPRLKDVKIEYKVYNDRPSISQAFSNGDLQVLFSAEAPQILCRAQGDDIRIVMLTTWAAQEIVVQNDIPASDFKDLRGRSLAVLAGTSSHYGILKLLETNNMTQSDIALKFMSPPEARTAFETKQIDAWAAWAPWVEQQTVPGRGKVLPGGDHVISIVMAYSNDLLTDPRKRLAAEAIASVILRGKKWTAAHPEEAQRITAEEVGLEIEIVKAAWGKQHWEAQLTDEKIEDIQRKATFLGEAGITRKGKILDVRRELIDLSILTSIKR